MTAGFFETDAEGIVTCVDETFAQLLSISLPPSIIKGQELARLVFPDRPYPARDWLKALGDVGERFTQLRETSGQHRWLELIARRSQRGIEGILLNVGERCETSERYHALTEGSPFGIVIVQDGIVVYANDVQEKRWPSRGRRANALLEEAMHPEDLQLVVGRIRDREAGLDVPNNYRYRENINGQTRWMEVWSSRVEYHGRPAVQTMILDVTDAVELEGHLRHAQKMEAIGRLAGGIAHDFNNLLTVILASTDVAMDNQNPAADLQQIAEAAERGRQLTKQLLAFSRHLPSNPRLVDVNETLNSLQFMFTRLVGERTLLRVSLSSDKPMLTRIDPGHLEQVITNLVVNAHDAMPGGGFIDIKTERVSVSVGAAHPAGDYIVVSVHDAGEGIHPEHIDHIFEPFFTTKDVGHGTGLGLSTVLGIVEECGGYVEVDSHPERGTLATVAFPLLDGESPDKAPPPPPVSSPKTGRVLVVEDEPSVRKVIAHLLEHLGFDVVVESSATSALARLREGLLVDIVLCDVVMPNMSGVELFDSLGIERPELPVILMTGYANANVIPEHQLGSVLNKPFTSRALLALFSEHLTE